MSLLEFKTFHYLINRNLIVSINQNVECIPDLTFLSALMFSLNK